MKRLAKQRRQASSKLSSPCTFKKVSCWPAKLAVGKSSAVADERHVANAIRGLVHAVSSHSGVSLPVASAGELVSADTSQCRAVDAAEPRGIGVAGSRIFTRV